MLERRNLTRRRICGSIVIGTVAAALLAVADLSWLVNAGRAALALIGGPEPQGAIARGAFRLAPPLVGVELASGALLGLVQGVLVAAVAAGADALCKNRARRAGWEAALYTAALTPLVAVLCAAAFSGRRARALPGHDLLVVGAGLVALAATYLLARAALAVARRLAGPAARAWPAFLAGGGLVALAALAGLADRLLFVRRYASFHAGAALAAFVALELAVLAVGRRWGRLSAPRLAAATLLLAVAVGTLGLARLHRPEAGALRAIAHEHGATLGQLLDAARALGLDPEAAVSTTGLAFGAPPAPAAGVHGLASDVFLITVDAMRPDHMGAYGYTRPTSPRLDALAAESTVFERAYTVAPHTSFAIASLLLGKYAFSLSELGLAAGHESLADVLRRYGYKTAGFFPPAVFYIDGERFKSYEERRFGFEYVKYEPFPEDVDAPRRTDQVIAFLEAEHPARAFVWVHYFGPHEPYVDHPPALPFGPRDVDRYDGEIRWVDSEIGRLVEYVRRTRPGAAVIVMADHGEEFGEHGGAYHGTTLFDEQARIPLIVYLPGAPPTRVSAPVSSVDVAPTILSLLDVTVSTRMVGADLLGGAGRPVFAEIDTQKMIVWGKEKLICDVARAYCRLFDLGEDPGERVDLSERRPERAAQLHRQIGDWLAGLAAFERAPFAAGGRRPELERGVLGDRRAPLADVVADRAAPVEARTAAARALARIHDEAARSALREASAADDPGLRAWATVALADLADGPALDETARLLSAPPGRADADEAELRARAAMALAAAHRPRAADALVAALVSAEGMGLRRELVRALGSCGDPSAAPALEAAYDDVRTRLQAAQAFGDLGDPSALGFLADHLPGEPYLLVRAAIAHALGQLGDPRAVAPLRERFAADPAAQVTASAAWALARLDAAAPVEGGRAELRGEPARELWLIAPRAQGDFQVSLSLDGAPPARYTVQVPGPADAYSLPLPALARSIVLSDAGPVSHALARP